MAVYSSLCCRNRDIDAFSFLHNAFIEIFFVEVSIGLRELANFDITEFFSKGVGAGESYGVGSECTKG